MTHKYHNIKNIEKKNTCFTYFGIVIQYLHQFVSLLSALSIQFNFPACHLLLCLIFKLTYQSNKRGYLKKESIPTREEARCAITMFLKISVHFAGWQRYHARWREPRLDEQRSMSPQTVVPITAVLSAPQRYKHKSGPIHKMAKVSCRFWRSPSNSIERGKGFFLFTYDEKDFHGAVAKQWQRCTNAKLAMAMMNRKCILMKIAYKFIEFPSSLQIHIWKLCITCDSINK